MKTENSAGVTVHRMPFPGEELGREFDIYNPATYWIAYSTLVLRHLNELIRTVGFDVIDFPEYGAEGFAYQMDRTPWNWTPVVVQLHAPLAMLAEHIGWPEKESDLYRVGKLMEAITIERADRLMACSKNIADFTATFYGVDRESIDVVHCGVDTESFYPGKINQLRDRSPTVLFVGNITSNKGLPTVLKSVLQLRSKYPDIRLQILGAADDELIQDLQALANRERAQANIEFLGFVDRARLPEFYQQASVFASPAQYEGGVANVYLEAMACGCPVIASTAGGAPEAVIDGETGFLVAPNDVPATTRALEKILSDDSLRQRMGETGRKQVERYFAMEKYISRVLATYEKAIDLSREKLRQTKIQMNVETEAMSAAR